MLDKTQKQARHLIITEIDKIIEKYNKKAEKEKDKRDNAYITYKGIKYYSDAELLDAYGCDVFSSATFDRLTAKLVKARGNLESRELTDSQCLVLELQHIKNSLDMDLKISDEEEKHKEYIDKRFKELTNEGYTFREAETIIGNEELMRYE